MVLKISYYAKVFSKKLNAMVYNLPHLLLVESDGKNMLGCFKKCCNYPIVIFTFLLQSPKMKQSFLLLFNLMKNSVTSF